MANEIITRFELDLSGYQAGIQQAVEGMQEFDDASGSAEGNLDDLSGKSGSAAKKVKELGVITDNTSKSLKTAGKEAGGLGGAFSAVGKELNAAFPAFGKIATAAKGLGRAFTVALGPVGIAIAAVVGGIGLLLKAFAGTQEGADKLRLVTETLGSIFNRLIGVAQRLGKAIFDAVSEPRQAISDLGDLIVTNITNRIDGTREAFAAFLAIIINGAKGAALAIKGIFSEEARRESEAFFEASAKASADFGNALLKAVTGVEDVVGKLRNGFQELGDEIRQGVRDGERLTAITKSIALARIDLAKAEGRLQLIYEEQVQLAQDVNRSAEERKAAAEAAIAASAEEAALRQRIVKLEIEELRIRQAQNDTSDAELLLLAQKEAELQRINADQVRGVRRVQNLINSINKQAADAEIAERQRVADARLTAEEVVTQAIIKAQRDRELAEADDTQRAVFLAQERAAQEIAAITNASNTLRELAKGDAEALAEIRANEAQARIEIEQNLASEIAAIRATTVESELSLIEQQKDAERELNDARLDAAVASANILAGLAKDNEAAAKVALGLQKSAAIAQIAISTAAAIQAALAGAALNPLVAAGGPAAVAAFAAPTIARLKVGAGISIATILAQAIGAFHDGGLVGRDGGTKVHGGRDGFLTRVERGEYVVPTQQTARYMPYLEAMRDGTFERMMAQHAAYRSSSTATPSFSFSDDGIVGAIGSGTAEERKQTAILQAMLLQQMRRPSKRYHA
jgi:hypothetical protein